MASSVGLRGAHRLRLLTISNPKVQKGMAKGYMTAILHLAPAWTSGHYNTCAGHTKECAEGCLFFAGRGAMFKVQQARIKRTLMFYQQRQEFIALLLEDIRIFVEAAIAAGYIPVIRLNGTSDIRWELLGIIDKWPDIQFYDYTKLCNRKNLPANYHLTFSFSGYNLEDCKQALDNGMSVAVPFLNTPPAVWLDHKVVDGDADDLRFLGDGPCIVALKAKGRLRNDPTSVFLGDNHDV